MMRPFTVHAVDEETAKAVHEKGYVIHSVTLYPCGRVTWHFNPPDWLGWLPGALKSVDGHKLHDWVAKGCPAL